MNNAIGSWNITILYCGGANVDMSLMISPNRYKFPAEGLNTIGEWPGCGTHTRTAESLCNRNIWVHDQQIFDNALISRIMYQGPSKFKKDIYNIIDNINDWFKVNS
jgi:hypothetical protein